LKIILLVKNKKNSFTKILEIELKTALGCTEPSAISFAAATAAKTLGVMPKRCIVRCSGNVLKNAMGVTIPNSGGLKGVAIAAILGIVGGEPAFELDVLKNIKQEQILESQKLLEQSFCAVELAENAGDLFISVYIENEKQNAVVEISGSHTNIIKIQKDDNILTKSSTVSSCQTEEDYELLNVRKIIEYAENVNLQEIEDVLSKQLELNWCISQEGLNAVYGSQVGRNILRSNSKESNVSTVAKALAACGSDARMGGCTLPVVINSGSGNQGITVSVPLKVYADAYGIKRERLIRALAISNLVAIHQKRFIGCLSAFCGAVCAASGAGAAITWMLSNDDFETTYRKVCCVIENTVATIGGMVCDGAKASCAAKIAAALDVALIAFSMSENGHCFGPDEGLVKDDVEKTIIGVGKMARIGMRKADEEILKIMMDNVVA
jgi:L-cysteine desulfidase